MMEAWGCLTVSSTTGDQVCAKVCLLRRHSFVYMSMPKELALASRKEFGEESLGLITMLMVNT